MAPWVEISFQYRWHITENQPLSSSLPVSFWLGHYPFNKALIQWEDYGPVRPERHCTICNSYTQGLKEDVPAQVIMDNFKGEITNAGTELMEEHSILVVLLLPTELLYFNRWICQWPRQQKIFWRGIMENGDLEWYFEWNDETAWQKCE